MKILFFAFSFPLSKGSMLADEGGHGKTLFTIRWLMN
jgi:hypothetical protein